MTEKPVDEPARLFVACGSYDGSVFAMQYECTWSDVSQTLKAVFIDPDAHPSPITALALGGDIVVSGSSDEAIQVFSLSKHCRLGCLEVHTGSISRLAFAPGSRHLLSTGEDACLAIWRRATGQGARPSAWQCIRQMRRHKGPITALALHPSGRLAFTIADDKTLRVWNLVRGRQAYAVRLKAITSSDSSSPAIDLSVSPDNNGRFLLLHSADRLDLVDLSGLMGTEKPLVSERFPKTFSVPPVFFREDDKHIYLLAGFGNRLHAFRYPISANASGGSSKLEPLGDIKLPGKRLKFLKVLPWPNPERNDQVDEDKKLVVFVTTDLDGSYVRGYTISLTTGNLADASAVRVVFTYDIRDIRLTHVDAGWATTNVASGIEDKEGVIFDVMDPLVDESDEEESEESMDEG